MSRTPPRPRGLGRAGAVLLRFLLAAGLILPPGLVPPASALPENGVVAEGQAVITQPDPKALRVDQASDRAVIDWRRFDVERDERVDFNQPSRQSWTVNRVNGGGESRILGTVTAPGNVAIINGNGVLIGAGARIDVGGLVATTADLDNGAFMRGGADAPIAFDRPGAPDARVVNEGQVTIREAGLAAFVAPGVENRGVIAARLGKVSLASGDTFTLDLHGDGLVNVAVDPATAARATGLSEAELEGRVARGRVRQSGVIIAEGGAVALTAAGARDVVDSVLRVDGSIQADSVRLENGEIVLGSVTLDAGAGRAELSGRIEARGREAGLGGGTVVVEADAVHLTATARIDASGAAGGGTVLLGGDIAGGRAVPAAAAAHPKARHERRPVRAARATLVEAGAEIRADATGRGAGGKVVAWAEGHALFAGLASARGGPDGGDGGFIEISGRERLDFLGATDTGAPAGAIGLTLLDPRVWRVVSDATFAATFAPECSPPAPSNCLSGFLSAPPERFFASLPDPLVPLQHDVSLITAARLAASTTSFSLAADELIRVEAPLTIAGPAGTSYAFTSAGQVAFDAAVDLGSGTLLVNAPVTRVAAAVSAGSVQITGVATVVTAALASGGGLSVEASGADGLVVGAGGSLLAGGQLSVLARTIRLDAGTLARATGRLSLTTTDGGGRGGPVTLGAGTRLEAGGELAVFGGDLTVGNGALLSADGAVDLNGTRVQLGQAAGVAAGGEARIDAKGGIALEAGASVVAGGAASLFAIDGDGVGAAVEIGSDSVLSAGGQLSVSGTALRIGAEAGLAGSPLALFASTGEIAFGNDVVLAGDGDRVSIQTPAALTGAVRVVDDSQLDLRAMFLDSPLVSTRGGEVLFNGTIFALQPLLVDATDGDRAPAGDDVSFQDLRAGAHPLTVRGGFTSRVAGRVEVGALSVAARQTDLEGAIADDDGPGAARRAVLLAGHGGVHRFNDCAFTTGCLDVVGGALLAANLAAETAAGRAALRDLLAQIEEGQIETVRERFAGLVADARERLLRLFYAANRRPWVAAGLAGELLPFSGDLHQGMVLGDAYARRDFFRALASNPNASASERAAAAQLALEADNDIETGWLFVAIAIGTVGVGSAIGRAIGKADDIADTANAATRGTDEAGEGAEQAARAATQPPHQQGVGPAQTVVADRQPDAQITWVDERTGMGPIARNYDDGATGARTNTSTRVRQVPLLTFNSGGQRSQVRFDGVDNGVLIDRKVAIVTTAKARDQARRQSMALAQNGLRGVWEVPDAAQLRRATQMLNSLNIKNIDVRIVAP